MLSFAMAASSLFSPLAEATISVDPAVQYQTWEGWGTSLAWWANVVGGYPEPLRTQLVDKAIGELGLTVLRYNIGGGEAPGYNSMEFRARIPGYLRPEGTYDWSADSGQRWVLQRGKALGANKFEAFSNSPPYFMTVSGSVTGAVGGGDNLRTDKVGAFAEYLATVVKRFKDVWGIRFETLAPMNEPSASWWTFGGRQEGCHVSPGSSQSQLVIETGSALVSAGSDTKVSAGDESFNTQAVSGWDQFSQAAKNSVFRVNTHSYGGSAQSQLFHRATRDAKRLWMSEYGDGDASGLQQAEQIVKDLRLLKPTSWAAWQVIDGGAGWGCIDVDLNNSAQTYSINRKFHSFKQFTKFIRPGAKLISIGDDSTVAALDGSRLVIIVVARQARDVALDLSRFTRLGSQAVGTRTSPTEGFASLTPISIVNKSFSASLPAESVTTFVIDGVSFRGPVFQGFYSAASQRSQLVLEVPGASWVEGAFLGTYPRTNDFHHQWHVEGTGNGNIMLRNRETGLYAALWDSAANNYPVLQWSNNGDTTLLWTPILQPEGVYRLDSFRYPGSSLVENPTPGNGWPNVGIYPWYAGPEQKWSFKGRSPLFPELEPRDERL